MSTQLLFALATALCVGGIRAAGAADLALTFPTGQWEKVKPEAAGFSKDNLDVLRAWLKTQQTTALQLSFRGQEIFEYGDLARVSKIASVRKSILAPLQRHVL